VSLALPDTLQSRLQRSQRLLIRLQEGADTEVVASAAALRLALQDMGRSVVLRKPERLPEPLGEILVLEARGTDDPEEGEFDLILNLGGAGIQEAALAGEGFDLLCTQRQDGPRSGPFTLGERVFDLLENLGARLDGPVAQALYVAISCATDSFQNDLVTPATHRRVARLTESGVRADLLARRLFREDSLGFLRLLGKVLASLRVFLDGRVVLGEVSRAELGSLESETDLLQRLVRRVDQVRGGELVGLLCEQQDGVVHVCLRSRRLRAHQVAAFFGGGGGVRQACFVLASPLVEARERLLEGLAQVGA